MNAQTKLTMFLFAFALLMATVMLAFAEIGNSMEYTPENGWYFSNIEGN